MDPADPQSLKGRRLWVPSEKRPSCSPDPSRHACAECQPEFPGPFPYIVRKMSCVACVDQLCPQLCPYLVYVLDRTSGHSKWLCTCLLNMAGLTELSHVYLCALFTWLQSLGCSCPNMPQAISCQPGEFQLFLTLSSPLWLIL
jgi:hypothetical protein